MNLDRKIKLLLLKINKLGLEINLETVTRYSKKFDSMTSEYTLKRWYTYEKENEETGETETRYYCKSKEFKRLDQVAKYLLAIIGNKDRDKDA